MKFRLIIKCACVCVYFFACKKSIEMTLKQNLALQQQQQQRKKKMFISI